MEGRNAYFQLIIKEDGTYLKLFENEIGGQAILYEDLSNYLTDKRIYEFDKIAVGRALAALKGTVEVKLTPAVILPQEEYIKVTISEDRMYAVGRFYPPANNGTLLTKNDIINSLVQKGIKCGVVEQSIDEFLQDRKYCTNYILAKATPAVQGHDAEITYHFNTDLTLKPRVNEDGTVDFHQLDMISHCRKDELLATLTPVDPGKPGIDIFGNVLHPARVNNKVLRHGNKIYLSEDGTQMYSEVDGHVNLTDGRVFVSDTYEIPADVDNSTGDIQYDGNVVVKGNVITGFSIKAKGDVEVNGVVEGAFIEAGGQIILKRGIQGVSKGILRAEGNIITKFIENAEVISGGYITTESILHSKVSAKGDITVGGRRGFVTGGEIRSGTMISVKTAGSQMGTMTLLEVGIDPKIVEEFRELEKSLASMIADKDKVAQGLVLFRKKLESGLQINNEKKEYLMKLTQSNIALEAQINEAKKRYDALRIEMEGHTTGSIKVLDTIYPGTKIVISNVIYFVRETVMHSKFIRDRADIKVLPL